MARRPSASDAFSLEIHGGDELVKLGRYLSDVAPLQYRAGVHRAMRRAADPGVDAARARARSTLPSHGGLGSYVAAAPITVDLYERGDSIRLRIVVHKRSPAINAGRFRHPVFGHRDRWVWQSVQPGWFGVPMHDSERVMRRELLQAAEETVDRIRRAAA